MRHSDYVHYHGPHPTPGRHASYHAINNGWARPFPARRCVTLKEKPARLRSQKISSTHDPTLRFQHAISCDCRPSCTTHPCNSLPVRLAAVGTSWGATQLSCKAIYIMSSSNRLDIEKQKGRGIWGRTTGVSIQKMRRIETTTMVGGGLDLRPSQAPRWLRATRRLPIRFVCCEG